MDGAYAKCRPSGRVMLNDSSVIEGKGVVLNAKEQNEYVQAIGLRGISFSRMKATM